MLFHYQSSCLLEKKFINATFSQLSDYLAHLNKVAESGSYNFPESSINLPADENLLQTVIETAKRFGGKKIKYIIDIGIGGSNLGTKAIYDALVGFYDNLEVGRYPKIFFADTTNPVFLSKLVCLIESQVQSPEEIVVNAISKSGGTTETTANMEIILQAVRNKFGNDGLKRVVVTSGEGSKFWQGAKSNGVETLALPDTVGGRYSVFSTVGLFPLAVAGFDITALLEGALSVRAQCLLKEVEKNPAIMSAIFLYVHAKEGRVINDNFVFNQELESVGKWYRQLMGESIGKEHDLDGKVVHAGITPTVSVGSTDLHSVGQLYLGGPRDKTTTFISAAKNSADVQIPSSPLMPGLVDSIYGKNASDIMRAILTGVKEAYKKQRLPFVEVQLEEISEYSLGEFLQYKMIEMMYLGKLLNVNTFDQPHVELYKIETKKVLEGN